MLSRILLAFTLTAPVIAVAQYVTTGPNGQIAPVGSTVIVVGTGGTPMLSTPSVSFGTPAGAAGISLSDRAGISNTTPSATAVPSSPETFPVYSNPNLGAQPATAETMAPAGNGAATTGRLINDVGPAYYAGAAFAGGSAAPATNAAVGATAPTSLGELAQKYKSSRPQNIRTYTNADAQRLSDSMNVRGANVSPVSAQNMPANAAQTQAASTETPSTTSTPASPQLSANLRPSPVVRAEGTQAGGTAQSNATPSTDEQSATTPQVGQRSAASQSQNNDQETGKRLPASSTLLPLFGILGLASGGLGLWLRRYRK